MDWRQTKTFVTNFNNLNTGFKDLIEWFLKVGIRPTVLDNASSYPPLLKFYEEMKNDIDVVHVGLNGNTWCFWALGFNTEDNTRLPYITTDGDCPPDIDCPLDLIERMLEILEEFPTAVKVSPGIRIDNLPDHYARKADAIGCQQSVAQSPDWGLTKSPTLKVAGVKINRAVTDTTFSLWRGGHRGEGRFSTNDWQLEAYRMQSPYLVKHVPWYQDSSHPSEEALFYRNCKDRLPGPVFGL